MAGQDFPKWMKDFVEAEYFGPCNECRKSKLCLNFFCLKCHEGHICKSAFCNLASCKHQGHDNLQVRMASRRNAIHVDDIEGLRDAEDRVDTTGIQEYMINARKIFYLRSAYVPEKYKKKAHEKAKKVSKVLLCTICGWRLKKDSLAEFCSLGCKLRSLSQDKCLDTNSITRNYLTTLSEVAVAISLEPDAAASAPTSTAGGDDATENGRTINDADRHQLVNIQIKISPESAKSWEGQVVKQEGDLHRSSSTGRNANCTENLQGGLQGDLARENALPKNSGLASTLPSSLTSTSRVPVADQKSTKESSSYFRTHFLGLAVVPRRKRSVRTVVTGKVKIEEDERSPKRPEISGSSDEVAKPADSVAAKKA